jgi:hypothetical protein
MPGAIRAETEVREAPSRAIVSVMSAWPKYVSRVRCMALRMHSQTLDYGRDLDRAISEVDEQIDRFLPALQSEAPGKPWSGVVYETHGKYNEKDWTVAYRRASED